MGGSWKDQKEICLIWEHLFTKARTHPFTRVCGLISRLRNEAAGLVLVSGIARFLMQFETTALKITTHGHTGSWLRGNRVLNQSAYT